MPITKKTKEYGKVDIVKLSLVKEKTIRYEVTSTPFEAADLVRPMFKGMPVEQIVLLGLDTANNPTVIQIVGLGGTCSASFDPGTIFKTLLLSNSSSFILFHNHPADSMEASPADKTLTRKLIDAAKLFNMKMLDHLIFNSDCSDFVSMRSNSLVDFG